MDKIPSIAQTPAQPQTQVQNVAANTPNTQTLALPEASSRPALTQLLTLLNQQKTITATVAQLEPLDQQAQQQLQKLNPELLKTVLLNTHQANRSLQGHSPHTNTGHHINVHQTVIHQTTTHQNNLYLMKLVQATSQQPLLTTITNNPIKKGTPLQLQLQGQHIVIQPSLEQMQTPIANTLKTAVNQQKPDSGLFQLARLIHTLPQALQQQLLPTANLKPLQQITSAVIEPQSSPATLSAQLKPLIQNSGIFTESNVVHDKPLSQDIRQLLQQLETILAKPIHHTSPHTIKMGTEPNAGDKLLLPLLQFLGLSPNKISTNLKPLTESIQQQLKAQVQQTQERIQFNQLRSLIGESATQDGQNTRQTSVQVDLPLRWGDQVLPLQLAIYEEREKKYSKTDTEEHAEEPPSQKEKRWQVILSFDLPDQKTLDSQITIIKNTVSATFWSESSDMYQRITKGLSELRQHFIDSGLEVDELQCLQGKAPNKKFSLDYNLIDVVT